MEPVFSGPVISEDFNNWHIFETEYTGDLLEVCQIYQSVQRIEYAHPDYLPELFGQDPLYNQQWAIPKIEGDLAWQIETGDRDVVIAVIDQGTQWDHPDLVSNIWQNLGEDANDNGVTLVYDNGEWFFEPGDLNGIDDDGNGKVDDLIGWDFVSGDNNPGPTDANEFHGTAVASIAGAATWNDQFMAGISGGWFDDPASLQYGCSIMPVRTFGASTLHCHCITQRCFRPPTRQQLCALHAAIRQDCLPPGIPETGS